MEEVLKGDALQDEYSILSPKHAIGIHGYILVYSVASRNSFDMIQIVHDKIADYCGDKEIPCVIVGSKADLKSRSESLLKPHGSVISHIWTDKLNRAKVRHSQGPIMQLG